MRELERVAALLEARPGKDSDGLVEEKTRMDRLVQDANDGVNRRISV